MSQWYESIWNNNLGQRDYSRVAHLLQSPHQTADTCGRHVSFIVIHITGGNRLSSAINTFMHPNPIGGKRSAHYIIDRDGTIVQMVNETNISWHTGDGNNHESIGIEHICSPHSQITDLQYAASAALVQHLCNKYGIPVIHNTTPRAGGIIGHCEIAPGVHPGCPNSVWNWNRYIDLVETGGGGC